jgi:tRNA-dependent cyclodipeptide synthase
MNRYKIEVSNSPGWRDFSAATLGISTPSPNWHGEKLAAILDFAAARFAVIRIDVTDALYRHNFMAEGCAPDEALARANAMGALWLAQHQDIIDACPVRPEVVRWAAWYAHSGYADTLAGFERAHELNPVLRDAVHHDAMGFYRRKAYPPSLTELEHSRNYLVEELTVITLQARTLPSVKLYPGEELSCLRVVRQGLVAEAPRGLEREQFARIRFVTRHPSPRSRTGRQRATLATIMNTVAPVNDRRDDFFRDADDLLTLRRGGHTGRWCWSDAGLWTEFAEHNPHYYVFNEECALFALDAEAIARHGRHLTKARESGLVRRWPSPASSCPSW